MRFIKGDAVAPTTEKWT